MLLFIYYYLFCLFLLRYLKIYKEYKNIILISQNYNIFMKGKMKQEILYKFGLGVFVLWEVYYSYWFLTIHNKIIKY